MRRTNLGMWTAIIVAIATAVYVSNRPRTQVTIPSETAAVISQACAPAENAAFAESVAARRPVVEGVKVCGVVVGRPRESGGRSGRHVYIAVRVAAPGGASYLTQVIPNENMLGRVHVSSGDTVSALGQFVYPNDRPGYEGLIHDTHRATHRGAADGYVVINGTVYR